MVKKYLSPLYKQKIAKSSNLNFLKFPLPQFFEKFKFSSKRYVPDTPRIFLPNLKKIGPAVLSITALICFLIKMPLAGGP